MADESLDGLELYRRKRRADSTPEPFGGDRLLTGGSHFVVQRHAARVTHYDFRLELDGVLKSWAVPKGPSPNPADKRLAVRTEDHPVDYAGFEGHIPEGNYGAGSVIVWDRGEWITLTDPNEGLVNGKLLFELRGHKLHGKWTLVKTRRGPKDWLLIKEFDGYVDEAGTDGYAPDSVLSGLTVEQLVARYDPAPALHEQLARLGARRARLNGASVSPMLARPSAAFTDPRWLFEIKYDGYRMLAQHSDARGQLISRAGNDLTGTFPEIVAALEALPFEHLVLDGEAVVHDAQGLPSFAQMQKRGSLVRPGDIKRASVHLPASFYAFDLLALGPYDLRSLALAKRKQLLQAVLPSAGVIRYCEHIQGEGEAMFRQATTLGLEGVVGKLADSLYRGGRSAHWVKVAVEKSDDFVVNGYTQPQGAQSGFGALLLAQYHEGELHYCGRVGSGFSSAALGELHATVSALAAHAAPQGAPSRAGWHWCEPVLVCEVKYKEVTSEGQLRQPVFLRMRDDKRPQECQRRSRAEPVPVTVAPPAQALSREVMVTNPDKVFWPKEGYTKGQLVQYYRAVSPWLLVYLLDRPLVLTRHPDGIEGKSFYQKDAPAFVPDWIRRETLWSEQAQRDVHYFVADDVESLSYIINMGTIALHIWSSRMSTLERPDWCVIDLDPKGASFADVLRIARAIRVLCQQITLPAYPKTSGSTGLHVLIPLGRALTYEQSRALGELIARVIVQQLPQIATIARTVSAREGKVYIDYLQNGHGRLLVAPYSVRPLPGAPVSMPVSWREVNARLRNLNYTIANAPARMKRLKHEPLVAVIEQQPDLVKALNNLTPLVQ